MDKMAMCQIPNRNLMVTPPRGQIWSWPTKEGRYAVGVDVGGITPFDPTIIEVFECTNNGFVQAAEFTLGGITQDFATMLASIGRTYNDALIAVECNNLGVTVNSDLIKREYPNVYRLARTEPKTNAITEWFGWYTNAKSLARLIDLTRQLLKDGGMTVYSNALTEEISSFPSADQNSRLMASMIAVYCANDIASRKAA
jgi:hypothetical protein